MSELKDVEWFKNTIAPCLVDYELVYRFFEKGDFGNLNQVLVNSAAKGAEVDFWSEGFLSILIWDYESDTELLSVFLHPDQTQEIEVVFEKLIEMMNYKK